MALPEESPTKTVIVAAALGALGEVPGLGVVVGAIQGVATAKARERDEEWWAMVAARVQSLEAEVKSLVAFDDPQFVAAAYRLSRAAQETADEEKRARLATMLAFGGSWSQLPSDARERVERLVAELSSREVNLLAVLSNPMGWLEQHQPDAAATYQGRIFGTIWNFLDSHLTGGDAVERAALRAAVEALERRGLIRMPDGNTTMTAAGALQGRATGLGWEVIHYLTAIGA